MPPGLECPTCDGSGSLSVDVADSRGEHGTEEVSCQDCDGTGVTGGAAPEDEEREEREDDNAEASWESPL